MKNFHIKIGDKETPPPSSKEDLFAELKQKGKSLEISFENILYLYQLFSEVGNEMVESKIPLIDQYMRMFFGAVIFTDLPDLSLASSREKDLINKTLKKESIPTIDNVISQYRNGKEEYKNIQSKASFFNITPFGIIREMESDKYFLGFPSSSDIKNDLLEFCLLLAYASLAEWKIK